MRKTESLFAMLLFAAHAAGAADTYDPSTGTLTIPAFTVGSVTYADAVVTVGGIVTPPSGGAPEGTADSYEPVNQQLTIPAVMVGGSVYYNAVITVQTLNSVGGVTGADVYRNGYLAAASVQYGANIYQNVILALTAQRVVSVQGGMPAAAQDQYDPAAGRLIMPAVRVGNRVYTNVIVAAGPPDLVAAGPAATLARVQADIFTPHCSFCHNGSGWALPGIQNLSSVSASMAALVSVPSLEERSVLRVAPGNPNASYLIEKLEGAPGIGGVRMTRGGPYLTSAQIEEVKSWIIGLAPP